MKKTTKIGSTVALFLCTSFLTINEVKAQNNSQQQSWSQHVGIGTIVALNTGQNSAVSSSINSGSTSGSNSGSSSGLTIGLIQDDITGEVYEFRYAGLEELEINGKYTYILQITASGKVIIRDIRHSPSSGN
ncbi:MAG: hypothetical protein K0S53_1543 [Bacteroidetes bacterium]|jgi:hypothetical protein|nr:hypothetical protein [Bacteroidota bacterium]